MQAMSSVYELIGRLVVRFVWARFGRQIRIAAGVGAVLFAAAGYLIARRQPPEG
jgi:hypothetical protein